MRNLVNKFNDEQDKYFWIFCNGKLESTNCKGKGKLLYKNYKSKLFISERNPGTNNSSYNKNNKN